jgi:hypothetical protein
MINFSDVDTADDSSSEDGDTALDDADVDLDELINLASSSSFRGGSSEELGIYVAFDNSAISSSLLISLQIVIGFFSV